MITFSIGEQMIVVFTAGNRAIVAAGAATHHRIVINARRFPGKDIMALLTTVVTEYVAVVLAGRLHAIVATETTAAYGIVIEVCRYPAHIRVAGIAGQVCVDVITGFAITD